MGKISVIMPVYNVEKYLVNSIESVLSQSYQDFELILVNDGSRDNSIDICERYKKIDDRIKVICKTNGGLSSARNEGIIASKGEYLFFVDSDDSIPNYCLKEMIDNITLYDADMCIGNFYRGNNLEVQNMPTGILNGSQALDVFYQYNGIFVVAWNKLYKKDLFKNIKYPLGKLHEDDFIAHELLYNCEKICFISEPIYNYAINSGSIMNSGIKLAHLDSIEAFARRIEFLKKINHKIPRQLTEYKLIEDINKKFFIFYGKKDCHYRCSEILSLIRKNCLQFFTNPYFRFKERIAICIFLINPVFYKKIILMKKHD